jgi:hypothetical protein
MLLETEKLGNNERGNKGTCSLYANCSNIRYYRMTLYLAQVQNKFQNNASWHFFDKNNYFVPNTLSNYDVEYIQIYSKFLFVTHFDITF